MNDIFSLIFGQGNYNDISYIGVLDFFVILFSYIKKDFEKIFSNNTLIVIQRIKNT